jgi:hypothetical protein
LYPAAMAQAVAQAKTKPEKVRTSAEKPIRTSPRPTGAILVSTDWRNLPSNIDPLDSWRKSICTHQ